ncbi:hypothetical protein FOG51_00264 [Hanseniaspora uvarum]|nr:hypothetical protein FOG51_00264 [Hanseniaspora uvarum]
MDTKSLLGRKKKLVNTNNNLYKLKFYCDICKKQLRDSNGLKQHNSTPLHKKNELLNEVDDTKQNKEEQLMFEFLRYLKNNGGMSTFQEVNKVYNAFILREKNHTHMISTSINNLSVLIKRIVNMNKKTKDKMLGGKYEVILKKPENDMIEEGEYSRYLIKMALIDDVGDSIDDTNIKNDRLIKQREMLLENQNIINHNPPKTSVKFKKKLSITCLKKKK